MTSPIRQPPRTTPLRIVRTCRDVCEDVTPSSLPAIPKGTYGIALPTDADDFGPVDFGPPWGVQRIGNHDLVDAEAVLLSAKGAIEHLKRPWRTVIRRTLRTFAGPYLVLAAGRGGGPFVVEAYLHGRTKRAALELLDRAASLVKGSPETPLSILCTNCDQGVVGGKTCATCHGEGTFVPAAPSGGAPVI